MKLEKILNKAKNVASKIPNGIKKGAVIGSALAYGALGFGADSQEDYVAFLQNDMNNVARYEISIDASPSKISEVYNTLKSDKKELSEAAKFVESTKDSTSAVNNADELLKYANSKISFIDDFMGELSEISAYSSAKNSDDLTFNVDVNSNGYGASVNSKVAQIEEPNSVSYLTMGAGVSKNSSLEKDTSNIEYLGDNYETNTEYKSNEFLLDMMAGFNNATKNDNNTTSLEALVNISHTLNGNVDNSVEQYVGDEKIGEIKNRSDVNSTYIDVNGKGEMQFNNYFGNVSGSFGKELKDYTNDQDFEDSDRTKYSLRVGGGINNPNMKAELGLGYENASELGQNYGGVFADGSLNFKNGFNMKGKYNFATSEYDIGAGMDLGNIEFNLNYGSNGFGVNGSYDF